ncbi:MAG: dynamin family protein [Planktothrix agardhii LY1]|uniref:dynamin family protein n=1 Tax=Planktothrix agardhii TaxID=1160 RepID=UPI00242E0D84|nr:dynamin family protein [Planktothrix agardhii]MCP9294523.1 dynamin family protein [Planktothrix agardhii LY1]
MNIRTANRSARIAEIIEKRQPLAQRIISVEANLKNLQNAIQILETDRKQQLNQWPNEAKIVDKLNKIDFSSILSTIEKELRELYKLRIRFARQTLNIGVVGQMKQGKSTLLQTLSGLSNDEIPARSGKACTAVRSTIYHQPENLTEALVTFHTEESFLQEVILPYFDHEKLANILPKTPPQSLDDFHKIQLPSQDLLQGNDATTKTIYKRLCDDYHFNFNDYSPFIGKQPIRITKEKIREYVAQEEENGKLTDSKHLAVRKVEISCSFPNANEIGKIALVDLPGLGDFKLGDEKLMLTTLGEEVDVVLFILKPNENGSVWTINDTELYNTASQALNELSARSFFVLNNKVNGDDSGNLKSCQDLKADIDQQIVQIKVVECLIADCRNPEQANQVLDQVLDYLETQVIELDARYAKSNQECLIQLHEQLKTELEKAKTALGGTGLKFYNLIAQEFNKLFGSGKKGWWRDVTFGLETLRSDLWLYREEPDINLQEQVTEAIQNCNKNKGILSDENTIKKIEEQIKISGALITYADYQDQLRVLLSHHFISLDDGLKKLIEGTKNKVAEVLIEKGRLGALTGARGSEFIRELEKLIDLADGDQNRCPHLRQGLRIFIDFELSYRGLVQHRIRKHLDELTNVLPSKNSTGQLVDKPDEILPIVASTTAEEILTALEIKYDKAVHRIQPALEELLWEPNQAAYAMVEEFVDNIIRQEDVQEEWKNFLMEVRSQVWPEELGQLENNHELRDHWLQLVKNVETTNQPELLQFLNV